MNNFNACLTHNSDDWRTPSKLFDYFINYLGAIDTFEYCSSFDQYEKMYHHELLFMNPPFSHLRTTKFQRYIYDLMINSNTVLMLLPLRCDTQWFKFLSRYISNFYILHGRLHFNDSKYSAPFPCMILRLDYVESLNRKHPLVFDNVMLIDVDNFIRCRYQ